MNIKLSDFQLIKIIGGGAHGKIYQARYLPNNIIVSLKEISINEEEDSEKQIKEINREIAILNDNNRTNDFHPNIMRFYNCFEENNKVYLVLEYIDGENLLQFSQPYIDMNQNIDQNLIIIILKGIINGLCYLFKKKILHRDISLNNIMIDKNLNIKITDFGISTFYKNNQNNQNNQNNNNEITVIGRGEYISPEIFEAYKKNKVKAKYDFKADIYSLGVTMFYLTTFQFPYEINDKERKRTKTFIDPTKYNQQLINIIMKMLAENQYIRPSCFDIYNELSNLIGANIMKENYKIKNNDINLKSFYIIKKSAFFSAIYSLYNISSIKSHFESDTVKERVNNFKQKSPELAIVIDSFIEVIRELKNQKTIQNKMETIINFFKNSSKKIITFQEYNKITPQLVIENLFDYFYNNITDMFVYNNKIAFKISEIISKNKNISPIIKQKVDEFKNNYSNIFADIFYFIILTKKTCPICQFLIEEEADIEYEIEFHDPGHIMQLFEDFEVERHYSNLGKKAKICKKCGIMPINLILTKSIFSAPNVLILHFGNDEVEIEENIEIKERLSPNKNITYILSSVIIKQELNHNFRYNIAINKANIDSWIYYTDDDSIVLAFDELRQKGIICTAFYKKIE